MLRIAGRGDGVNLCVRKPRSVMEPGRFVLFALNGKDVRVDQITSLDGKIIYDNPDKQFGPRGTYGSVDMYIPLPSRN